MAREFSRTDRVGQQVHKEVASILQNEFKHREPETGFITISSVEVSRDLAHAKIYVTFYGDDEDVINADLVKLKDAKPMVRSLLAKRLRMRSVPDLHFFRDESITEGIRISTLVSQARASDDAKTQGKDEEE